MRYVTLGDKCEIKMRLYMKRVNGISDLPIPSLWSKFAPFRNNCVEITKCEQDRLELCFFTTHFKSFLVEVVQRLQK